MASSPITYVTKDGTFFFQTFYHIQGVQRVFKNLNEGWRKDSEGGIQICFQRTLPLVSNQNFLCKRRNSKNWFFFFFKSPARDLNPCPPAVEEQSLNHWTTTIRIFYLKGETVKFIWLYSVLINLSLTCLSWKLPLHLRSCEVQILSKLSQAQAREIGGLLPYRSGPFPWDLMLM